MAIQTRSSRSESLAICGGRAARRAAARTVGFVLPSARAHRNYEELLWRARRGIRGAWALRSPGWVRVGIAARRRHTVSVIAGCCGACLCCLNVPLNGRLLRVAGRPRRRAGPHTIACMHARVSGSPPPGGIWIQAAGGAGHRPSAAALTRRKSQLLCVKQLCDLHRHFRPLWT